MLIVRISIPGNSQKVLGIVEVRTYLENLIQKFKERTEKQFDAKIFHHFKNSSEMNLSMNHKMRLLKTTFFVKNSKKDF